MYSNYGMMKALANERTTAHLKAATTQRLAQTAANSGTIQPFFRNRSREILAAVTTFLRSHRPLVQKSAGATTQAI